VPKTTLNDIVLRNAEPPLRGQFMYWDCKLPGFGCRVSQGGAKTFILKHDNRRITIGRFPIISLSEARDEAKRILAEFTLGRVRPQSLPYAQAVEVYLDDKAKNRRPRTIDDYRRLLERHFPFKGQLSDITHTDVVLRLNRLRNTPSEYNHALTGGKIFFNWCLKRRYVTENPFFGLSLNATQPRTRVLTQGELVQVWHAADRSGTYGTIVQLLMLTGQRRGEIAGLQDRYIDRTARTITLPGPVVKNGRQHTFPYENLTEDLLKAIPAHSRTYLLSPPGRDNPLDQWTKAKQAFEAICKIAPWTLHDLRRTFATGLAELGVAPHVIERLLNHAGGTISGVAAVYNRFRYMDEMREAIKLWEARLHALLSLRRAA
jgi:integrase